jgi:hypothetical protein
MNHDLRASEQRIVRGVVRRPSHQLDALIERRSSARHIARYRHDLVAAFEQCRQEMLAYEAGGARDDDSHGHPPRYAA